ncbi:MAG: hypothetical protein KME26_10390 [Oscillatoria princeps RMCB-10]|nr:hypothetical protein [Oscillatoria princeps RMCB-10]
MAIHWLRAASRTRGQGRWRGGRHRLSEHAKDAIKRIEPAPAIQANQSVPSPFPFAGAAQAQANAGVFFNVTSGGRLVR